MKSRRLGHVDKNATPLCPVPYWSHTLRCCAGRVNHVVADQSRSVGVVTWLLSANDGSYIARTSIYHYWLHLRFANWWSLFTPPNTFVTRSVVPTAQSIIIIIIMVANPHQAGRHRVIWPALLLCITCVLINVAFQYHSLPCMKLCITCPTTKLGALKPPVCLSVCVPCPSWKTAYFRANAYYRTLIGNSVRSRTHRSACMAVWP